MSLPQPLLHRRGLYPGCRHTVRTDLYELQRWEPVDFPVPSLRHTRTFRHLVSYLNDLCGGGRLWRCCRWHHSHHNGCRSDVDASIGASRSERPSKRLLPDSQAVCGDWYQSVGQHDSNRSCGGHIFRWWRHLDELHPLVTHGLPHCQARRVLPPKWYVLNRSTQRRQRTPLMVSSIRGSVEDGC